MCTPETVYSEYKRILHILAPKHKHTHLLSHSKTAVTPSTLTNHNFSNSYHSTKYVFLIEKKNHKNVYIFPTNNSMNTKRDRNVRSPQRTTTTSRSIFHECQWATVSRACHVRGKEEGSCALCPVPFSG